MPFVIPPLVKMALGALGIAALVQWTVREARRIHAELDRVKPAKVDDPVRRQALPTLRRDPLTGEWRIRNQ
jgi:hypothetical protein